MQIIRNGSIASLQGPADWFSGQVRIDMMVGNALLNQNNSAQSRLSVATVSFEVQARTHWHTHPVGQLLIITSGKGQVQVWGEPIQEVQAGDIVWFPAGVKHWHGATDKTAMTHIAIQEEVNGSAVSWLESVSDEQFYGK